MTHTVKFYPTRYGLIAHFASDRHIGMSLEVYGEWAEAEIVDLLPRITPGSIVLDVGANIGTHTLPFARKVGPNGYVFAFEAQPEIASLLSTTIVANGLSDRVTVLNALAGASLGQETYRIDKNKERGNWGAESFVDPHVAQPEGIGTTMLSVVTIDSLDLPRCDLIKLDVEGMELQVVAGAKSTIARHLPVIYFEQRSQTNLTELRNYLTSLGYVLYWHVTNPFNTNNFLGSTINRFDGNVEVNILALPPGAANPPLDMPEITQNIYNPDIPDSSIAIAGVALDAPDFAFESPADLWTSMALGFSEQLLADKRELTSAGERKIIDLSDQVAREQADKANVRTEANAHLNQANAYLGEIDALRAQVSQMKNANDSLTLDLEIARQEATAHGKQSASLQRELLKQQLNASDQENRVAAALSKASRKSTSIRAESEAAVVDRRPPAGPTRFPLEEVSTVVPSDIEAVLRYGLFDAEWYRRQLRERGVHTVPRADRLLAAHYLAIGWTEHLDPHPFFDTSWYLERESDVARARVCPLKHFLADGRREWREPHPLFSTRWYVDSNPDAASFELGPFLHFVRSGAEEHRDPHPLFSTSYYLERYPDLKGLSTAPIWHFLTDGSIEGRSPHPLFDADWYRDTYATMGKSISHPLLHHLASVPVCETNPNPFFDAEWYRTNYVDLAKSDLACVTHYVASGEREGRWPNPAFDPAWYSAQQGLAEHQSALAHFIQKGRFEGLAPCSLFSPAWYARKRGGPLLAIESSFVCFLEEDDVQRDVHPLFATRWYLGRNPEAAQSGQSALAHYLSQPHAAKPKPNPVFDPDYYLDRNPDVARAGLEPLAHYIAQGEEEGRQPCAFFDPAWFTRTYPNARKGFATALEAFLHQEEGEEFCDPHPAFDGRFYAKLSRLPLHDPSALVDFYERTGGATIADCCPLFDGQWYMETYGTQIQPGVDPLLEYLETGWRLGREPNRYFATPWYKAVSAIDDETVPLLHYLTEGKGADLSFNPLLDPAWYASYYPETRKYPGGPLAHFLRVGESLDRTPTALFDPAYYRAQLPAQPHGPIFRHFIEVGSRLGAAPNSEFNAAWYCQTYGMDPKETNPLTHYVTYGEEQGFKPNETFDPLARKRERLGNRTQSDIVKPKLFNEGDATSSPVGRPSSRVFVVVAIASGELERYERLVRILETADASWSIVALFDEPQIKARNGKVHAALDEVDIVSVFGDSAAHMLFCFDRERAVQVASLMAATELMSRPDCKRVIVASPHALLEEKAPLVAFESGPDGFVERQGQVLGLICSPRAAQAAALSAACDYMRAGLDLRTSLTESGIVVRPDVEFATRADPPTDHRWMFSTFENGERVTAEHRAAFRSNPSLAKNFPNPFCVDPGNSFYDWCLNRGVWLDGRFQLQASSNFTELHRLLLEKRNA